MFAGLSESVSNPNEAVRVRKNIFREAAGNVREFCFVNESSSKDVILSQLSSISRCVWLGNMFNARKLKENTIVGETHLDLSGKFPKLAHPKLFEKEFAEAKQWHLNQQKENLQKTQNNSEHQKSFGKPNSRNSKIELPCFARPPLTSPWSV